MKASVSGLVNGVSTHEALVKGLEDLGKTSIQEGDHEPKTGALIAPNP